MKENSDIFSDFLCTSYKSLIKSIIFPKNLKLADITPQHKKSKKDIKWTFSSVIFLPNL